ncbi:MAG: leucine-rich repeat domain-containing protein [Holosporaceae bacterium]|jgi:hypothetical protein|nr:leucine-rich repeat domain-containing protein [Holosporaceae bacterium]
MKKLFIVAAVFTQFMADGMGVVDIPNRRRIIDREEFCGRKDIEEVRFGGEGWTFWKRSCLTDIGASAFEGGIALRFIHIPSSVERFHSGCFWGCTSLEAVIFEENSRLTEIGEWAFNDCSALKSIFIPSSVTSLGMCCFSNCHALESICIPSGVTRLRERCFSDCTSLRTVSFERNSHLTDVWEFAFEGCSALESICIPSSVTHLGQYSFRGCTDLGSVRFEENSQLSYILEHAFQSCHALKSICIPRNVVFLEEGCFCDCRSLVSVHFESGMKRCSICASCFWLCPLRILNFGFSPIDSNSLTVGKWNVCAPVGSEISIVGCEGSWEIHLGHGDFIVTGIEVDEWRLICAGWTGLKNSSRVLTQSKPHRASISNIALGFGL